MTELSTAVLHDVLEDTDWTIDDLAESGVETTVLEAVETLTRRSHEEDDAFVARICATPGEVGAIAQRVKLADLTVNVATADSDEERERFERSLPTCSRHGRAKFLIARRTILVPTAGVVDQRRYHRVSARTSAPSPAERPRRRSSADCLT